MALLVKRADFQLTKVVPRVSSSFSDEETFLHSIIFYKINRFSKSSMFASFITESRDFAGNRHKTRTEWTYESFSERITSRKSRIIPVIRSSSGRNSILQHRGGTAVSNRPLYTQFICVYRGLFYARGCSKPPCLLRHRNK